MSDLVDSEYSLCIFIPDSQEEGPDSTQNIYSRLIGLKQVSDKSQIIEAPPKKGRSVTMSDDGSVHSSEVLAVETASTNSSTEIPEGIPLNDDGVVAVSESNDSGSGGGISDAPTAVVSDTEGHGQIIVPRAEGPVSGENELHGMLAHPREGVVDYASSDQVTSSSSSDDQKKTSFISGTSAFTRVKESSLHKISESQEDMFHGDDQKGCSPESTSTAVQTGEHRPLNTVLAPETCDDFLHSDDDDCIPPTQEGYTSAPHIVPSSPTLQSQDVQQGQPLPDPSLSSDSSKTHDRESNGDKDLAEDAIHETENTSATAVIMDTSLVTKTAFHDHPEKRDVPATQHAWSLRLTPTQTQGHVAENEDRANEPMDVDGSQTQVEDVDVAKEEGPATEFSQQASEPHFRLECPSVTSQVSVHAEPSVFVKVKNSPKKERRRARPIAPSNDSEDYFSSGCVSSQTRGAVERINFPATSQDSSNKQTLWEMTAGVENVYSGATQDYSLTRYETPPPDIANPSQRDPPVQDIDQSEPREVTYRDALSRVSHKPGEKSQELEGTKSLPLRAEEVGKTGDPYEYRLSQSERDRQAFQEVLKRGDSKRQMVKEKQKTTTKDNPVDSGAPVSTQQTAEDLSGKIIKRTRVVKRVLIERVTIEIIENGKVVESTTTERSSLEPHVETIAMIDACTMIGLQKQDSDLHISPSRSVSTVTSGDLGDVSSMSKSSSGASSLAHQLSVERSLGAVERSVGTVERTHGTKPLAAASGNKSSTDSEKANSEKFATPMRVSAKPRRSRKPKDKTPEICPNENKSKNSANLPNVLVMQTESLAQSATGQKELYSNLPGGEGCSGIWSRGSTPDVGDIHISSVRVSSAEPDMSLEKTVSPPKSTNTSLNKSSSPVCNKLSESLFTSPEQEAVTTSSGFGAGPAVTESCSPMLPQVTSRVGFTSIRSKASHPPSAGITSIMEVSSQPEEKGTEADSRCDKRRGKKRKAAITSVSEESNRASRSSQRNIKPTPLDTTAAVDIPKEEVSPDIPYMGTMPSASSPQMVGWDNENRVLARWKGDKFFYPATLTGEEKDGRHQVLFDDDTECYCLDKDLVKLGKLPEGQSVMAGEEGNYESGIIRGHFEEGVHIGYVVELDNGRTERFPRKDVILTADQAADILHIPLSASTGGANISLDNLVESSRRPRKRPRLCELTPTATSTPTPKDKKKQHRKSASTSGSSPSEVKTRSLRKPQTVATTLQFDERGPIPSNKVFKGLYFLLTHAVKTDEERKRERRMLIQALDSSTDDSMSDEEESKPPFDKDHLRAQLIAGGGMVVDKFTDIQVPYKKCFLISDTYQRTMKYLHCLAANVPCVSHCWIMDSCKLKKRQDYKSYILPAGVSIERCQLMEWHNRGSLLRGVRVFISHNSKEYCDNWSAVLLTAGCVITERLKMGSDMPDVILTDSTCPRSVVKRAKTAAVPLVSTEWVIQCLIMGEKLDYDGHDKYRHDYSE